ncbi:MAG: hypothetical protein ACRCR1_10245 [Aeromonas sp.]
MAYPGIETPLEGTDKRMVSRYLINLSVALVQLIYHGTTRLNRR